MTHALATPFKKTPGPQPLMILTTAMDNYWFSLLIKRNGADFFEVMNTSWFLVIATLTMKGYTY
jgi:hypothetical protein